MRADRQQILEQAPAVEAVVIAVGGGSQTVAIVQSGANIDGATLRRVLEGQL